LLQNLVRKINEIDRQLMYAVARKQNKALTYFFRPFTYSGFGVVWFGVAALLWAFGLRQVGLFPQQQLFLRCMFAPLVAWAVGHILKLSVHRKRPRVSLENFTPLTHTPSDYSFPSNHAAASTAFFVSLLMHAHPFAPYIGLWALLVSLSRVYLGVHFPSDVVAGTTLGLLCGLFVP
jgi:undecaprenyl-diphosphatase